jgi:hypothetical protein
VCSQAQYFQGTGQTQSFIFLPVEAHKQSGVQIENEETFLQHILFCVCACQTIRNRGSIFEKKKCESQCSDGYTLAFAP